MLGCDPMLVNVVLQLVVSNLHLARDHKLFPAITSAPIVHRGGVKRCTGMPKLLGPHAVLLPLLRAFAFSLSIFFAP